MPISTNHICKRVIVIGTSCSGKTTLARTLSEILGIPHVELDALHWAPNWKEVPDKVMRERVAEVCQNNEWVIDGNYMQVRDIVWGKADTIVWLNYSFPTTFFRGLKRTVKRVFTKEELWHGNKEHWHMAFFSKESVLWWVITTHAMRKRRFTTLFQSPDYNHLTKYIFCTPKETQSWLDTLRQ